MSRFLPVLLLSVLVAGFSSAHAIEPIPEEEGWSGYLRLGAGALSAETNQIAGIDRFSLEIGDSQIDSLDSSPDSESAVLPQLNLNLKYTFATQTQLFAGNSLEDIVQLDAVTVFGVRQQFKDRSIVELSSVASPVLSPVQVWADPYVVGENRKETDRTSQGLRLEYDKILGTGFGLQFTHRKTEIDDELSGTTQLGLSPEEAALLDREGTVSRFVASYRFKPVGRHVFQLNLGFREDDYDGKALAGDANDFQLIYVHLGDRFLTAFNTSFITKDFDASDPVFDKTRDDDSMALAFFVIDKHLFDSNEWWGQASIVWVEQDSNIDFYDQSSTSLVVGVQRNF